MKSRPMVHGLLNGDIIQIEDVESGLKCNCICPECGSRLVAHKGEKVIQHFKHYDKTEIESCYESAIHLASKALFAKHKEVRLPNLKVFIPELGYNANILQEKKYKISKVNVEKYLIDFKPDILAEIIVKSKGETKIIPLIIEIAVTHFVDYNKLLKIEKSKISAIEISLKDVERIMDDDDLWFEIQNPVNIKWLYNNKTQNLIEKKINTIRAIEENREKQRIMAEISNENYKLKLKKEGYLLLKIYKGRKEYIGTTVDEYIFTGKIYCPKQNNTEIDRSICEKCLFNHGDFKNSNEDFFRIICGFKNNRLNHNE
ncbi:hypothetical protein GCM10011514_16640 [Emticicia aquatilis]|uniref:Competence protein n=1 Tax=Emticicia aquatilis TaxID=1537369 RepID=A0A917DMZ7_9BACT|nr:competence protein CoiA family protein [Emticicia aquatilis]GGD53195.1 hypothetical protein GCM10011514_16640 [Emticicia aquatilis]